MRPSKPLNDDIEEPVYLSFRYCDEELKTNLGAPKPAVMMTGDAPNSVLSRFGNLGEIIKMNGKNDLLAVETVDFGNGNGAVKTTENPKTRTPENPRVRTTENPKTRTPENRRVRTPENVKTRTTENPRVRMLSNLGLYFDEFLNYKNVQTRWNLSGFTRRIDFTSDLTDGLPIDVVLDASDET